MMLEVLAFICTVIFILWVYTRPEPRLRELGNQMPGPFCFPIVGNLNNIPRNGEEQIRIWQEAFQNFGNIWRTWIGNQLFVLTLRPEDMEIILSSKTNITKSSMYDLLHGWLGNGLLTSTGSKWHMRRKAITPAFHFKILEQFIDVFNKNSSLFINKLGSFCDKKFNIYPFVSDCTLDVICETSMGTNIRAQTENSIYVAAVRKMNYLVSERIRKPWLLPDILYRILRSPAEVRKTINILHEHTLKVIQDKKKEYGEGSEAFETFEENGELLGLKRKLPLLELLLKMKNRTNVFQTDTDIREEVDTFMFEGHDTTSAAISFTISLLSTHPKIQNNVFEELVNVLGNNKEPEYEDLVNMKYLERVIKESLRLYPSVPIIARLVTEDIVLSDYTLPVGTTVILPFFFLHRDEKHFPNPLEFNPDNFLPDACAKRHAFAYLPFSAGPRNCIGQKFAMIEMKMIIAKLIINYRIEAGDELKPESDIILHSVNGHKVILTQR